ncbi:hypothetical protein G7078_09635 [Sphingomonas sinipercae]|uniref:Uncharacterized protein n=1 Tax=Sphingomonas sinipercae TaxID=2714944 RepID=A0A6G7ZPU1_9SPHN|nr:hypothetical protein [Sphingomonas sinipercae]QIL03007.1 hypothetical protein G7078_09635 [Sphingomonas sinipercae]
MRRLTAIILVGAVQWATPASAQAPLLKDEPFLRTCAAKGKFLWGRSLCAPVVVIDPATSEYQASKPAPGPLPPNRANSSLEWGGETWVMVLAPLPQAEASRTALLFHEAFHVHAKALGFGGASKMAAHLDDAVGRYLIRLEWNALAKALGSKGAARRRHIAQALAFRAQRLRSDRAAAESERDQMRSEGLANYTGIRLSGEPAELALKELRGGAERPSLSRTFAYVSGPAWGLLLDDLRLGWRRQLDSGADLPDLMPVKAARTQDRAAYGGADIWAQEYAKSAARTAQLNRALAATAPGRALALPLRQAGFDFDPNGVSVAPDGSTIYRSLTLRDRFGSITVRGGYIRVLADFSMAYASLPLEAGALTLAPGWQLVDRPDGGARLVEAKP